MRISTWGIAFAGTQTSWTQPIFMNKGYWKLLENIIMKSRWFIKLIGDIKIKSG
jgi:hypothetical protein